MSRRKITFDGLARLPFEEWEEEGQLAPGKKRQEGKRQEPSLPGGDAAPAGGNLLYYFSMGSGSSGNSCYIGTSEGGIIIDAGVRADEIEKMLKANGVSMSHVKGVLLTHDHNDHVKYVYTLVRNNRHMKVFCTNRVLQGLLRRHPISKRIKEYHTPIFKEIPFPVAGMEITAFEVPHDGSDNMGFSIEYDNRRFVLATDMGRILSRARHYISGANYLVIESNYDRRMLLTGRYPEFLKARIQTETGHMDNEHTALFLREMVGMGKLEHIFLCHLSKDNNTPEKALTTVRKALEEAGITVGAGMETIEDRKAQVQLTALPRYGATRLFVFRRSLAANS